MKILNLDKDHNKMVLDVGRLTKIDLFPLFIFHNTSNLVSHLQIFLLVFCQI